MSQSGAIVTAMLDWATPRGIGFSHVVSLGDMADVDFGDMLDYLAADPQTRAILLYVEGITHGRKFMSAARAAARAKPVLVVKVGRFAAGAARRHARIPGRWPAPTRSMTPRSAAPACCASLRMAELFDAVETLALTREQIGDRLAILTNGGGAGVLATDALMAAGGRLAQLSPETDRARSTRFCRATWSRGNPVDIIGDAAGARYAAALDALIGDREVDAMLVLNCPTALASAGDAARAVIATSPRRRPSGAAGRNLFTAWLGEQPREPRGSCSPRRASRPTRRPTARSRGFMHRVQLSAQSGAADGDAAGAAGRLRSRDRGGAGRRSPRRSPRAATGSTPRRSRAVLAAYRHPVCRCPRRPRDPDEAAAVAAAIGFPVALKIRSPDITHKSDVGGVALDLAGAERGAARGRGDARRGSRRRARRRASMGSWCSRWSTRPGAVELIVGLVEDPVFGPVVACSARAAPRSKSMRDTLARAAAAQRAAGAARRSPAPGCRSCCRAIAAGRRPTIDAVVEVLIRLAQLAAEHPQIRELDINPLLADADGVIALDARHARRARRRRCGARLAIAPYPEQLASRERCATARRRSCARCGRRTSRCCTTSPRI